MPKRVALFVPLPMIKSPVVVTGDKALKAADAVVWPVPPEAMATVPVRSAADKADSDALVPLERK